MLVHRYFYKYSKNIYKNIYKNIFDFYLKKYSIYIIIMSLTTRLKISNNYNISSNMTRNKSDKYDNAKFNHNKMLR